MGRYYAFHLYYLPEQVTRALHEVARWADTPWIRRSTLVISGISIDNPFAEMHSPGGETIRLTEERQVTYPVSLWMPDDPMLHNDTWKSRKRNGAREYLVGYIYVKIRADLRFVEIAFIAAVSDTSIYFQKSAKAQQRFLEFSKKTEAIFGLFFDQNHGYPVLGDWEQRVQLSPEHILGLVYTSPDIIVDELLPQIQSSRTH